MAARVVVGLPIDAHAQVAGTPRLVSAWKSRRRSWQAGA